MQICADPPRPLGRYELFIIFLIPGVKRRLLVTCKDTSQTISVNSVTRHWKMICRTYHGWAKCKKKIEFSSSIEFSSKTNPIYPRSLSLANKFRFSLGRRTVTKKFERVIQLLKEEGFHFTTFADLRKNLMKDNLGNQRRPLSFSTTSNNVTWDVQPFL